MGIWFKSPKLQADEVMSLQVAANFLRKKRSIGGQITVTGQRLVFVPNRLDGLTGGHTIDVARSTIAGARVAPPGRKASRQRGLAASIRPQVEIDCTDGTLAFIVRDVEGFTAALGRSGT
jgi:hypothetical protein